MKKLVAPLVLAVVFGTGCGMFDPPKELTMRMEAIEATQKANESAIEQDQQVIEALRVELDAALTDEDKARISASIAATEQKVAVTLARAADLATELAGVKTLAEAAVEAKKQQFRDVGAATIETAGSGLNLMFPGAAALATLLAGLVGGRKRNGIT